MRQTVFFLAGLSPHLIIIVYDLSIQILENQHEDPNRDKSAHGLFYCAVKMEIPFYLNCVFVGLLNGKDNCF